LETVFIGILLEHEIAILAAAKTYVVTVARLLTNWHVFNIEASILTEIVITTIVIVVLLIERAVFVVF